VAATGALALLFYLCAPGYLRVNETELVFPREIAPRGLPAPAASLGLPYRNVDFRTADSVRLNAWVVPARHDDSTGYWVLLCHGQTGNVATTTRPQYYAYLRDIGVNILAFDWRGLRRKRGSAARGRIVSRCDGRRTICSRGTSQAGRDAEAHVRLT